jgi:hypothetical protein
MTPAGPARIPGGYYIKARKIKESWIAHQPPCVREVWDYLIREANFADNKYNGHATKRGQLFRTYSEIRDALSWTVGYRKETYSEDAMKKAMKKLRSTLMIDTKKAPGGVLITVKNYDLYQDPKNYEGTNEGTTESTIAAPLPHQGGAIYNKKVEERKNLKKESKTSWDDQGRHVFDPKPFFETFWEAYPRRKGKKIGKGEALAKYKIIVKDESSASKLLTACNHYSTNCGEYAKDAHRWLARDRWKEWISPDIKETPIKVKSQVFDALDAALKMKGTPENDRGPSKAPIRRNPRQLPVPRGPSEDHCLLEPDN